MREFKSQRSLSPSDITQLSPNQVARLSRRLDYRNLQQLRQQQWKLGLVNEAGIIAPEPIAAALDAVERNRLRSIGVWSAGIPVGPLKKPSEFFIKRAGAEPDRWTAIGPANIGGRTRSIAIHPTRPDRIWIGSVGGGVWLSEKGGNSWRPVNDRMANLAISTIAIDPKNPRIVYAGTGEHFTSPEYAIRGAGIFWTTDGETWSQMSNTTTAQAGSDFEFVNRIAVSPDGKIVLAATMAGLFRSDDPERKNKWTKVSSEIFGTVHFHPTDPQQAIAGGLSSGAILYSTNGGLKWSPAKSTLRLSSRVELAYAHKRGSKIVYASVDVNGGTLLRSADGGLSFVPRASASREETPARPASYLGTQGVYDNTIWAADPTNEDLVIVGGIDLWRSEDGGETLERISRWQASPRSAHADHHAIVSHPGYDGVRNRIVFFANDGGLYKGDDVRRLGKDKYKEEGWSNLNTNYAVTQLYGGAAGAGGRIIVGAQDNGTWLLEKGKETKLEGGDGGFCAADPAQDFAFYGEYIYLNLFRAVKDRTWPDYISGTYWDGKDWVWKDRPYSIPDAQHREANFIAPFVLDPNAPTRILAGGRSLWRTDNAMAEVTAERGPEWYSIKAPGRDFISAIAISPKNSDIVWVCHNGGEVYRSDDATKKKPGWALVSEWSDGKLPKRNCLSIGVDPRNSDVAYVTFAGFEPGNIWKTANKGGKWTDVTGNLPRVPVRSVTVHPRRSNFIYVGTEIGLFATEKGGLDWSPTNDGPVNTAVSQLFWNGDDLMAATYGRGLFSIQIP